MRFLLLVLLVFVVANLDAYIVRRKFTPGEPFKCPPNLTGYHVDNQRCSDFHYCLYGEDTGLSTCPPGKKFNRLPDGTVNCAEKSSVCP